MWNRRNLTLLVSAMCVGGFFLWTAFAPVPVQAAAPAQATPTGEHLERALKRLLEAEANQQKRLDHTEEVEAKTNTWIDRLESEGKDASALKNALQAFLSGVSGAQSYHDQASEILADREGFDSQGHVTDLKAARETVSQAGHNLREAHLAIVRAAMDFRQAVRNFIQSHRPVETSG
jgi:predicted nuclease with TOPRIM domain